MNYIFCLLKLLKNVIKIKHYINCIRRICIQMKNEKENLKDKSIHILQQNSFMMKVFQQENQLQINNSIT